ncbi:otoferlin-like isoform X3 [Anneissia japonica]|uniref:otoferlin-like isoform X3 n=1 Tax=Anneissia japonica TaxID=1529436 RepID=UPI0014256E2B|nr:otoferlin-like isoform X3 [Anneissia japonica]
MALFVTLKSAGGFRGRGGKVGRITFRGVTQSTQVIENAGFEAIWDEVFEWGIGSPITANETIEVSIFIFNKFLSNRLIGRFQMVLQEILETGHVSISEPLVDANNTPTDIVVSFDLEYQAPDGTVGDWMSTSFAPVEYPTSYSMDDLHAFDDDGQYQPSLYSHTFQNMKGDNVSQYSVNSRRSRMSALTKFMKGKKKRRINDSTSLISVYEESKMGLNGPYSDPGMLENGVDGGIPDDTSSIASEIDEVPNVKKLPPPGGEVYALKPQDFQVNVTVVEARNLAGLNIDPVVCVQVGDQKKFTSVKESTNCPFWDELFVFDFNEAPLMMFDKIIKVTALHSRNILRSGTVIGMFKLDVGTIYYAPDHCYYHKWAIMIDPQDVNGGPKGYVKLDIAVLGKGDTVKSQKNRNDDLDDDLESNLFLPEGVSPDRQLAKFFVKIFKAEDLPVMNSGMLANVKKVFTGELSDLVDPYVEITFAGQTQRTSVQKHRYEPMWNEQIVFSELFPPLCRRIKVQLKDKDSVMDDIIGTTYIDLAKISCDGPEGFLPTFGPSWVNLYGSTRQFSSMDSNSFLNLGVGEGCMYRGRILLSMKSEMTDSATESGAIGVEVEPALPISENAAGKREDFFFFASVFDASMIDMGNGDKPISFEFTIGVHGNQIDGKSVRRPANVQEADSSDDDEGAGLLQQSASQDDEKAGVSMTLPVKPETKDKNYYHIPYEERKPIVFLRFPKEDHRRRFYNMNILSKIAEKFEHGLGEVNDRIMRERPRPDRPFKRTMLEFAEGLMNYSKLTKGTGGGSSSGKTKLDKERNKMLITEVVSLCKKVNLVVYKGEKHEEDFYAMETDEQSDTPKAPKKSWSNKNHLRRKVGKMRLDKFRKPTVMEMREKMKLAKSLLQRIKHLAAEPQHCLPDLFIWMLCGGKRTAYCRVPSRKLMYSVVAEEKGEYCGKINTLFLRLPGKKASGPEGWSVQAKLDVYLWLGLNKHRRDVMKGLPTGYEQSKEVKSIMKPSGIPPLLITYKERHCYQLRCHMYQARSIIGSDDSGLSDPFARVIFGDQIRETQVIEETLSPTWDELLLFEQVVVYGNKKDMKDDPPTIAVEVFDKDLGGGTEFIGRALVKPVIKLPDDVYCKPRFPPMLAWYNIYRGQTPAGEILCAIEMIELTAEGELPQGVPAIEVPADAGTNKNTIMAVPREIKPVMSRFRIELMFWGVREMKRLQLTKVDRPKVDIECAGHVISSAVIFNANKNPNFTDNVKFLDVDLPENEIYCPPLTIRVVDCRSFGRFTLVGTHVVNSLANYKVKMIKPEAEKPALLGPEEEGEENGGIAAIIEIDNVEGGSYVGSHAGSRPGSRAQSRSGSIAPSRNGSYVAGLDDTQMLIPEMNGPPNGVISDQISLNMSVDNLAVDVISNKSVSRRNSIKSHYSEKALSIRAESIKAGSIKAQSIRAQSVKGDDIAIGIPEETREGGTPEEPGRPAPTPGQPPAAAGGDAPPSQAPGDGGGEGGAPAPPGGDGGAKDQDEESLDWWTRYFATKKLMNVDAEGSDAEGEDAVDDGGFDLNNIDEFDNRALDDREFGEDEGGSVYDEDEFKKPKKPKVDLKKATMKGFKKMASGAKNMMKKNEDDGGGDDEALTLAMATGKKSEKHRAMFVEEYVTPITIYPCELESVPEFEGFREWMDIFPLYRGKNTGEDEDDSARMSGKFKVNNCYVIGKLKGGIRLYQWPLPEGEKMKTLNGGDSFFGYFQGLPSIEPVAVLVRVYVVKAIDLHPADTNGKADPYLQVILGSKKVNDKENYVSKQLNPNFGKCFEFETTFPMESKLTVQVYDWDMVGSDDIIGQTEIDLENRYYSKHRAVCGICKDYAIFGYNNWRDPQKPAQILKNLCKEYKFDGPHFSNGTCRVNQIEYSGEQFVSDESGTQKPTDEHAALEMLKHWDTVMPNCKLVPEHIETRPLYHPDKPGVEQGRLEMWVDLFPMDSPLPGAPVDITPRKPKKFELRVIIWNTEDVVLEDASVLTGEKMSDIFVKGFYTDPNDDLQATDVHYRSLTGEGNFNWRFIFPFEYLEAEQKIVVKKKESMLSIDETEYKLPPRLTLQVWDADAFSADDFLGACVLDLTKFPRGAKTAKSCKPEMMTDPKVPQMNLFKVKKHKGFWPFVAPNEEGEEELMGKVEAELILMSVEEAEKSPAGYGRDEPDPMEKPNRPDLTGNWLLGPLASLKYLICNRFLSFLIKLLILTLIMAIFALFIYSAPGYTVKKIMGA